MATLKDEILALLANAPGLTDREITDRLRGRDASQQPVNQACRQLEAVGALARTYRHDGLIGNNPTGQKAQHRTPRFSRAAKRDGAGTITDQLSEDDLKRILSDWLEREGWSVTIAWGQTRGPDCVAVKGKDRWIIETKGCGSLQPMRVNYFLGALGEVLQRMDDSEARYSVGFPDMAQFQGLWERLPKLAKERTGLTALFVRADGTVRVAG